MRILCSLILGVDQSRLKGFERSKSKKRVRGGFHGLEGILSIWQKGGWIRNITTVTSNGFHNESPVEPITFCRFIVGFEGLMSIHDLIQIRLSVGGQYAICPTLIHYYRNPIWATLWPETSSLGVSGEFLYSI